MGAAAVAVPWVCCCRGPGLLLQQVCLEGEQYCVTVTLVHHPHVTG